MSDELTELTRRLGEIQDRLLALPDDAFEERIELKQEQRELRERAKSVAVVGDAQRSDDDLLAELRHMRDRMKAIEAQRIDLVRQAGGGSPGSGEMGNLGGVQINKAMDDAAGLPQIKARIGVIKGVLSDRGVSIPPVD